MTSFLSKKRDNETFAEKLETVPTNTKRNKLYAVKVFEDFVCEKYNNSLLFYKGSKKTWRQLCHRIVGHSGYLMQYNRLTEDEKW